MYAIIETGGKQYQVQAGDVVYIEKLENQVDDTISFTNVLAVNNDGKFSVGAPYIDGASVEAKVLRQGKAKKVVVFTYKRRKNEKRKMGHRQPYTKVEITAVNA